MSRRIAACLMLLAVDVVASAEPLGRLFFTPEQRAVLERQRRDGSTDAALADGERLRLDGIVTRSAGPPTIWANGRPLPDPALAGIRPRPGRAPQGASVPLADGSRVDLNVGETLEPATGARSNVVTATIRSRRRLGAAP